MEDGMYVWNCRFCKKVNKTKDLFYCETNYRTVIQKNSKTLFINSPKRLLATNTHIFDRPKWING